jgi:dCTP deaminase
MILNDKAISALAENDILFPYVGEKVRTDNGRKVISYGLSQCGYDIRLSATEFKVFNPSADSVCPKLGSSNAQWLPLFDAPLRPIDTGGFFILPPCSAGAGVSLERFSMPDHVFATVQGKSTYACQGLITNVTPIEPGWCGHLTMCFINPTPRPLRLYANEGIAQVLFYDCGTVNTPYEGVYQNQGATVRTTAI